MSSIGRCESCTHWKRYAEAHPNAPGLASKAEVVGGICKSPKFVEDAEYELDMLVYSYREGGEFWTGPQFGCIHWARAETMKIAPLSAEVESVLAYAENCVDSDPTARGIKCLAAEIRRLHACLEKSNSNHEHFEREWYLRGDEIERLHARVRELEECKKLLAEHFGGLPDDDLYCGIKQLIAQLEQARVEIEQWKKRSRANWDAARNLADVALKP